MHRVHLIDKAITVIRFASLRLYRLSGLAYSTAQGRPNAEPTDLFEIVPEDKK